MFDQLAEPRIRTQELLSVQWRPIRPCHRHSVEDPPVSSRQRCTQPNSPSWWLGSVALLHLRLKQVDHELQHQNHTPNWCANIQEKGDEFWMNENPWESNSLQLIKPEPKWMKCKCHTFYRPTFCPTHFSQQSSKWCVYKYLRVCFWLCLELASRRPKLSHMWDCFESRFAWKTLRGTSDLNPEKP